MEVRFEKIDINRFDELNIFSASNFEKYKLNRIKSIKEKSCDLFVAIIDEKYIGEITIKYEHDLGGATIQGKRVYLEAFRVKYEYRNHGIGQQFLLFILNYLKSIGYSEVTVGIEDENKRANYIYHKYGFIEKINMGYNSLTEDTYSLYLKRD